ncbi:MAG: GAF domain-containing sensor histidine kinase [Deltaproteobacteria bacterium]|nr:GAF domain-containing sensor histidine kinase [Deltaproteobacteria bacterium]
MDLAAQLERERAKVRSIQQIARAVGSTLDLDDLLRLIVGKITELMDAERSTLYVMDETRTELWTKVLQADELREIRLRVGEGVAGWAAQSGQTVNIADAYADPRFNPDVDRRSGYRTRSILCLPMKDNQGRLLGVVQVLNKRGGAFDAEDEELLEALASQVSIAIENSQLYLSVVRKNKELITTQRELERRVRELDLLFEVQEQTQAATNLEELLEGLLKRTSALIGAEAASLMLQERSSERLYFLSALGERGEAVKRVSVALGEGIAGWVAQQGRAARVADPDADPRHNRILAERVGFRPRNVLCVPLIGQEVRGAIELLNKVGRDQFDDADLRLLTLIAGRASQAIELARVRDERLKEGRLASIGQLLSGVLHDLKTPMTIISGYAQLMATSDEEKVREEYAEQVLRQFDVMSAMTREVLAFARGESNLLIRKVYLHKFLREMQEHLRHEFAGRGIQLVVEQRYKGVAFLDEIKFRRVFHNIGRNAAEAMPEGGVFTIGVDVADDRLLFSFSDTGRGIPPELEGRLFELFATAGKAEGSGLGLAIVKKIVEEHEGHIAYRSEPGAGTVFTISLPLQRAHLTSGEVPLVATGGAR